MLNKKIAYTIFILVCLVDLYVAYLDNDFIRVFTKPLPILVIGLIYAFTARKVNYFILGSLVISFVADTFLLDKPDNFSIAVSFFVIAHILCIKFLISRLSKKAIKALVKNFVLFMLFFGIIGFFVLPEFILSRFSIFIYGTSICFFAATAFSNYLYRMTKPNLYIFIGVFIHLMSDGVYSVNIFREPEYFYTFLVLCTYFIGHFLLYKGFALKR